MWDRIRLDLEAATVRFGRIPRQHELAGFLVLWAMPCKTVAISSMFRARGRSHCAGTRELALAQGAASSPSTTCMCFLNSRSASTSLRSDRMILGI